MMMSRYKGPIIIVLANICFACSFSLVKFLSVSAPIYTIMLVRFLAGPLILAPIVLWKKKPIRVTSKGLFAIRISCGISAMMCLFYGLKWGDIATCMVLFECSAIWVLMWGAIMERQWPHRYSMLAIPLTFLGVVFILQPTGAVAFQLGEWCALIGSFLNAGVYISLKKLRDRHDTITIVLVAYTVSVLILAIPNGVMLPSLSWPVIGGICAMSLIGFGGQIGMTMGFKFAQAGISSVLMLSIIPFTTLSGIVLFSERLNMLAWAGLGMTLLGLAVIGRYQ